MYFLRLTKLKAAVEAIASESWADTNIGGEDVKRVDRVLDIRQGELCWTVGTVYMDMALKPNILEDVSKDVSCLGSSPSRGRCGYSCDIN
jgi:DNA polymerase delta subunit 2